MPLVGGGVVPLALKDVPAELSVSTIPPAGRSVRNKPEVAATVGTHNLDALHAKRAVLVSDDGAGDALEEGRPAAAAGKLGGAAVQRGRATRALVHTRIGLLVVLTRARALGALVAQDAELLWRQHRAPFGLGLLHREHLRW